jgi:hypothetical protein
MMTSHHRMVVPCRRKVAQIPKLIRGLTIRPAKRLHLDSQLILTAGLVRAWRRVSPLPLAGLFFDLSSASPTSIIKLSFWTLCYPLLNFTNEVGRAVRSDQLDEQM